MGQLVIYAPNVVSYGGLTLLQAMLDAEPNDCVFWLNENVELKTGSADVVRCRGGFAAMVGYERSMRRLYGVDDVIIAVTNRAPIFHQSAYVVTFLASVYAIFIPRDVPTKISRRLKSKLQQLLNVCFKGNTNAFLVRSEEMKEMCERLTGKETVCCAYTTAEPRLLRSYKTQGELKTEAILFYPSDASSHKNHERTVSAWRRLRAQGNRVRLRVTISNEEMEHIAHDYKEVGIEALGRLKSEDLASNFKSADALFFPSLLESFPLPILEARSYKLPIIASERRFIREQIDPEETFDPLCSYSIAAAVNRFTNRIDPVQDLPVTSDMLALVRRMATDSRESGLV